MRHIEWKVYAYYGKAVRNKELFGSLAISTTHADQQSMTMEVAAAVSRPEIGVIRIERVER